MLIAIILCLFSVVHGLPYLIRVDPSSAESVASIRGEPPYGAPSPPAWNPPPSPPRPSQAQCCATRQSCCKSEPSLSYGPSNIYGQDVNTFHIGNSGNFWLGGILFPKSAYRNNRLQYISNQAYNVPYYRNNFNDGSQGSYAPRDQQEFQVPVSAAIINTGRSVEYRDLSSNRVSSSSYSSPQVIDVEALSNPVSFNFRTVPSPITITQTHTAGAASPVQQSQTVEQPQRLVHQLVRPIIHDVREIIQPFRHVTQEIQPVLENSRTIVARGGGSQQYAEQNATEGTPSAQQVGEFSGQSVVDVNNVQQQQPYGFVSNVVAAPEIRNQAVGGVPNSYQPFIGYSQQQPVVGVQYGSSSVDGQVVSNAGNRGVNNGQLG